MANVIINPRKIAIKKLNGSRTKYARLVTRTGWANGISVQAVQLLRG